MDTIFLRGIRLEAMIGIYRRERTTTQPVTLDLELALPNDSVFRTGKVADTIDYGVVVSRIAQELAATRYGLVEELADAIAALLLREFHSPWVRLSVAKLGVLKNVGHVGVTIERSALARTGQAFASGSDPFAIADTSP